MSGTRAELRERVPGVGEHTDAVLTDCLQLPAATVQRLREAGVFGPGRA
jgi:crotonobetainyl-CoA:carnitine CoA-transferase CaiB-like acyl-CoA transferase